MRIAFFIIAALASVVVSAGCENNAEGEEKLDLSVLTPSYPFNSGFYNPIKTNKNLGDPWMMRHTDGLYYYSGGAINIFSSPTISGFIGYDAIGARKKNVLADIAPPDMREIWAPEVHHYNGRWYVFFTATHGGVNGSRERRENRRSYVLRSLSDDAFGEWEFRGQLDLPEGQWAIDPTFLEHKGKLYCIWSGWKDPTEGIGVHRQRLYITELEDGDPSKVKAGSRRVEIANPTLDWEIHGNPVNEGPCIVKSPKGTVFCIYSASLSTTNNYRLGYLKLVGDDPMDPSNWWKNPNAIFEQNSTYDVYGPGHNSVVTSPDGTEYWMIFHTAKQNNAGWDRHARAQRLYWEGEDENTPSMKAGATGVTYPDPLYQMQPIPSGEPAPSRLLFEAEDMVLDNTTLINLPAAHARNGRPARAVKLNTPSSSITMGVIIEEGGYYSVQLRHSNYTNVEQEFHLYLNGSPYFAIFRGSRSGASASSTFTMDAAAVILLKGLNTLKFTASTGMDVDCVILERMDRHPW